jgi:tetratricopeptide (TPR) repeat protein
MNAGSAVLAALSLAAALCGQQRTAEARPPLFALDRTTEPALASADRSGVSADRALRELAQAADWRITFETSELESTLGTTSLDLSFTAQPARTVAHLIAAAGGADVVFDDTTTAGVYATQVHVVSPAAADLDSGRQRLRERAVQWYHSFLQRDQVHDPLVQEEGMRVRMQLAHLKREQGDLEGALATFKEIHDRDRTHPYTPLAMLRVAQCNFELQRYPIAEEWARKVNDLHPSLPETAAATVLLGKVLIAQQRYDECVQTLRANLLQLADTPEIVDIYLLVAEAQMQRGRADETLRNVEILAGSKGFRDLTEAQFRAYWFLRGYGALGVGQHKEAMEALELFLGIAADDRRRGHALVLLAGAYLGLDRLLEARACALATREHSASMSPELKTEARVLQAKTALLLGDHERGFEDLEVEVRRDPHGNPELILYLVGAFAEVGRFQKAVVTADLLAAAPAPWRERALAAKLEVLWKQAQLGSAALAAFPAVALDIAREIDADKDLQRRAAEIIGAAYEKLGDIDRAADAYRGVLR